MRWPWLNSLKSRLRYIARGIPQLEAKLHDSFYKTFPRFAKVAHASLDLLWGIVISPAFAVILALLLVGFVISGIVSFIVSLSVYSAWSITVLSIARHGFISRMRLPTRICVVSSVAIVLALVAHGYAAWCITNFQRTEREHATKGATVSAVTPAKATIDKDALESLKSTLKQQIAEIKVSGPSQHTHVSYNSIAQLWGLVNMPALTIKPGNTFAIPIGFKNVGDYPVESTASSLTCVTIDVAELNTAFSRIRKNFEFSSRGGTLPAHVDSGSYQTTPCPTVTDDIFRKFVDRQLGYCGLGAVKWKDGTGYYETDFGQCLLLEPEGKGLNWHNLPQTNNETRVK